MSAHASALMEYDRLQDEVQELRDKPNVSEEDLAEKKQELNELYKNFVEKTTNTQLVEKDGQVWSSYMKEVSAFSTRSQSLFLRVLDAEQFCEAITARISEAGSARKFLHGMGRSEFKTPYYQNACTPRSFAPPETRSRAPREKHREAGPAKQTVAFDEDALQNKEAQVVDGIKLALRDHYLRNGHRAVPLYQFALNRDSFSQTVENLFYLSFLVRDNFVAVQTGADNVITVRPLFVRVGQKRDISQDSGTSGEETPEKDALEMDGLDDFEYFKTPGGHRTQAVMQMQYDLWVKLRESYHNEPLILSRRDKDASEYTPTPPPRVNL